jgi:hypothetical protein
MVEGMSDHDHHHDHDDEDHRRIAGILFGGLFNGGDEDSDTRRQRRERHAAQSDDMKNRMFAALRSMNAEQLFMVRHILITGMNNAHALQWFDGIINAIMQVQHGVDPDTGKTPEEMLLENAAPVDVSGSTDSPDDRP